MTPTLSQGQAEPTELLERVKLTTWTERENYGDDFVEAFNAGVRACIDALAASSAAPTADLRAAIYVASRASLPERPEMWRALRVQGWPINSTWIDEAGPGETADMGELWQRIEGEVRAASGVILYAELDDFPLKGAYIEVGMALGMGKRVAVVTPDLSYGDRNFRPVGSWVNHPLVKVCDNLNEARSWVARHAAAQLAAVAAPDAREAGGERSHLGNPASGDRTGFAVPLSEPCALDQGARPVSPLTDEQIEPLFRAVRDKPGSKEGRDPWFWFAWGVEMGERAHGIAHPVDQQEGSTQCPRTGG